MAFKSLGTRNIGDAPAPPPKKVVKITIEYEKEIISLEGAEAEKWNEAVNAMGGFMMAHGMKFPDLKWETRPK